MRAWEQGYWTASDRKLDEGLGARYCTASDRKLDEGLGARLLYCE